MAGTSASVAKANRSTRELNIYDYVWLLYSGQTLAAAVAQMGVCATSVTRWNDTIRDRAASRPGEMVIEHSGVTWAEAHRLAQKAAQHERDVSRVLSGLSAKGSFR